MPDRGSVARTLPGAAATARHLGEGAGQIGLVSRRAASMLPMLVGVRKAAQGSYSELLGMWSAPSNRKIAKRPVKKLSIDLFLYLEFFASSLVLNIYDPFLFNDLWLALNKWTAYFSD